MQTPQRIAFVNQPIDRVLPPLSNSLGLWTYEVARRLAENAEVHVFGPTHSIHSRRHSQGRIHYHLLSVRIGDELRRRTAGLGMLDRPGKPRFATSLYYLDFAVRVVSALQRIRPDVIHVQNFSQFVPLLRRLNCTSKIVLHMHCEWLSQMDARMIRRNLEPADGIVGCSRFVTEATARAFPHLADRCHTIYNGVDLQVFAPARPAVPDPAGSDLEILYVGRVAPEKGGHDLIRAFGAIAEKYPRARLKLIGGIASGLTEFIAKVCGRDPLEAEIARLYWSGYREKIQHMIPPNAASRITFVPVTPNSELPGFYRHAGVFVFPSAWNEPFGMPILEAMACEKPVVATRSGGIPEIVEDRTTGLLVERGNPQALAAALAQLLDDPKRRLAMGRAGRQRVVERFSWDHVAANLLAVYRNLPTSAYAGHIA